MSDSSQNGYSSTPHPLVRPPVGERASRYLASDAPEIEPEASAEVEEAAVETETYATPYTFDEADIGTPGATISVDATPPLLDARLAEESEDEEALSAWSGSGGEPPANIDDGTNDDSDSWKDPNTPHDKELGLIEHLAELRSRILYCVVAVSLAMVLTWNKCDEISEWFARPIRQALQGHGKPISTDPTGFFTIYLQISLVSALILTMPFLLLQIWRFIEPALTNNERKFTLVLVPFSSVLFFLGAGMGYWLAPMFFKFFLEFQPVGVDANWDYFQSVILLAKTILVFGLAFQVPVVTIFLNKSGLVSRNILIHYWRHAVVVIFTVIAIVTPTWDPITMTACAIPPCLLYLLSIWLVKWL
ncbi:Sec-independent protein translocase protein TatC [Abditibacteriota bacterium]|nr:Sec-independent protein translocase protein TatC [Abditibacteriota bacterium]